MLSAALTVWKKATSILTCCASGVALTSAKAFNRAERVIQESLDDVAARLLIVPQNQELFRRRITSRRSEGEPVRNKP